MHDSSSPLKLKSKTWEAKEGSLLEEAGSDFFRERESSFSLGL